MDKVIWMLWFQGWDNAPEANKICFETWKYHNPDWIVCGLDEHTLGRYIDTSMIPSSLNRDITAQSDIIRLMLLEKYGGVWADSTVFCNKPLDDWLPNGTFMFTKPNKFLDIASWYISAPKESYTIRS